MIITLNGQKTNCQTPLDLQALLEQNGYGDKMVAVALNGGFVPRQAYGQTNLNDGDDVEIVAPMQGG